MLDCQASGLPATSQNPVIEENSSNMAFYQWGTEIHFGLCIFIDFMQTFIILSED